MEKNWNPIVNGDLSKVPCNEEILFTVLDEKTGEVYTTVGKVHEFLLQTYGHVFANRPVKPKALKAWMELPEPFEPGRCDVCKHNEHWTDCFGDRWSKCKFSERMFVKGCPIEKEVD